MIFVKQLAKWQAKAINEADAQREAEEAKLGHKVDCPHAVVESGRALGFGWHRQNLT